MCDQPNKSDFVCLHKKIASKGAKKATLQVKVPQLNIWVDLNLVLMRFEKSQAHQRERCKKLAWSAAERHFL